MFLFRDPVLKAKGSFRRTPRRTAMLSTAMKSAVKASFLEGITRFKHRINKDDLAQAWATGRYDEISRTIPFAEIGRDMDPMAGDIGAGYASFGELGLSVLPPANKLLRYDVQNPRIERFINNRVGELVTNIERDTQKIIQQAVVRSFTRAESAKDVADRLVGAIGLLPRDEQAIRNLADGMIERGYTLQNVQTRAVAYENRLLDSRAMTIARTEMSFARNYGQLYVWQEAENQGAIPVGSKKVWNTAAEPCDICDPMDGIAVSLSETWALPSGDSVDIPSESHPNCMCIMTIELEEE